MDAIHWWQHYVCRCCCCCCVCIHRMQTSQWVRIDQKDMCPFKYPNVFVITFCSECRLCTLHTHVTKGESKRNEKEKKEKLHACDATVLIDCQCHWIDCQRNEKGCCTNFYASLDIKQKQRQETLDRMKRNGKDNCRRLTMASQQQQQQHKK